jgi:hypothetical protein
MTSGAFWPFMQLDLHWDLPTGPQHTALKAGPHHAAIFRLRMTSLASNHQVLSGLHWTGCNPQTRGYCSCQSTHVCPQPRQLPWDGRCLQGPCSAESWRAQPPASPHYRCCWTWLAASCQCRRHGCCSSYWHRCSCCAPSAGWGLHAHRNPGPDAVPDPAAAAAVLLGCCGLLLPGSVPGGPPHWLHRPPCVSAALDRSAAAPPPAALPGGWHWSPPAAPPCAHQQHATNTTVVNKTSCLQSKSNHPFDLCPCPARVQCSDQVWSSCCVKASGDLISLAGKHAM